MRRILYTLACVLLLAPLAPSHARGQRGATPAPRLSRVLLIPLDDRPPCLQFPVLLGLVGDVEVVAPPRSLLGRFLEPGQPERIAAWLRGQELGRFDAAIISADMLAYGGLVNSRVHRTPLDVALKRLELVRWLKRRAPRLPVYGSSVIMRLAPTAEGRNSAYRDKLSRWAEISSEAAGDASLREEAARLEREIPAEALADYRRARERNFAVNRAALALVRAGVFDYLIVSQDDAKPRGVHVRDRERLFAEVTRDGLVDRVAVQPGADEVSMLLLARALNRRFGYSPRVAAVYSSERVRDSVAPFEDRPLSRTVSFHIAAAGGREVAASADANLLFFVYGSRAEEGAAARFAGQVERAVQEGRRVVVADVDMKGDLQGADPLFTRELRERGVFPRLAGYASWNTAGNTIGTALPHGLVFNAALARLSARDDAALNGRVARAQVKFLLHRLLDDYAYHSLVRPELNRFAREHFINPNGMGSDHLAMAETMMRGSMCSHVYELWKDFFGGKFLRGVSAPLRPFAVTGLEDFRMSLPRGRTFEAEIDFTLLTSEDVGRNTRPEPRAGEGLKMEGKHAEARFASARLRAAPRTVSHGWRFCGGRLAPGCVAKTAAHRSP